LIKKAELLMLLRNSSKDSAFLYKYKMRGRLGAIFGTFLIPGSKPPAGSLEEERGLFLDVSANFAALIQEKTHAHKIISFTVPFASNISRCQNNECHH
jgi:hypothetical protein